MADVDPTTERCATKRDVRLAWAIHALTASGVLLGAAGLEAVVRGHPRTAIVYLIAAMIVDGIDGPIARAANVADALPGMDGNILDLVVDYLTCVMLPVAFMAYFHAFPSGWTVILCAAILFTAVLWFAAQGPDDRGPLVPRLPRDLEPRGPDVLPAPQPAVGEHRHHDHPLRR